MQHHEHHHHHEQGSTATMEPPVSEERQEVQKDMQSVMSQLAKLQELIKAQAGMAKTTDRAIKAAEGRAILAGKLRDLGVAEAVVRSVFIGGLTVGALAVIGAFFESDTIVALGVLALLVGPLILMTAMAGEALYQLRKFLAQEAA